MSSAATLCYTTGTAHTYCFSTNCAPIQLVFADLSVTNVVLHKYVIL